MRYRLIIIDENHQQQTIERVSLKVIQDIKKLIQDDPVRFPKWALFEIKDRQTTEDNPFLETLRRIEKSDSWAN